MIKYTVTIGDSFTSRKYKFLSESGNYSIEFLAGVLCGATDLREVPPSDSGGGANSAQQAQPATGEGMQSGRSG